MRRATLLITIASVALVGCAGGGTGARQAGDPPVGANCRVQLKRSDLGAAASRPISPTVRDSDVSVSGRLLRIDADWVVLDTKGTDVLDADGSKVWVPRRNVLLMQFP